MGAEEIAASEPASSPVRPVAQPGQRMGDAGRRGKQHRAGLMGCSERHRNDVERVAIPSAIWTTRNAMSTWPPIRAARHSRGRELPPQYRRQQRECPGNQPMIELTVAML